MEKQSTQKIIHRVKPTAATIPTRTRVAAYCRVSTGKETMMHSLSVQISKYSVQIQNHPGWEYAGVYADAAFTGTKESRPRFQQMLEDCRAGRIDMIITKSVSRFARNTVTLLATVRELRALGVAVYFEEEHINSMSKDGELILTFIASFAQEESKSVSDNCKWRIRKDFAEGKPMNLMLLYGYTSNQGRIEIVPEEAAIVRRIFSEYVSGDGECIIANRLLAEGVPCRYDGNWSPPYVGRILKNEKYTGDALLQKTFRSDHLTKKKCFNRGELPQYYAEETHPAIIDHETFEKARAIRADRKKRGNVQKPNSARYPFSSLIICGMCGWKYRRRTNASRITWQCSNYLLHGKKACCAKQIPEDTLVALTCDVLGISEVTDEALRQFKEIRIPRPDQITFCFLDGHEESWEWHEHSRAESWTDEMKQKARQQMKRRYGHE